MTESDHTLIRGFEEQLLQPAFRACSDGVAALLAEDFLEIGASGCRYDKAQILAALARETGFSASLSDFEAHTLAAGWVLATYRARLQRAAEPTVESLRSSLWCLREGRWQLRFHQGTVTTV
ncbi:MAG TPA: DUF4440 domain-containing protein [Gammaproteobacteria bacterium]